jgi:hypothetical protein
MTVETFEVCILKMDRPSREESSRIYKIRDELNKRHSVKICGEQVMKFIVIYCESFDTYYLTYECNDLVEASKFRKEAREIYTLVKGAEKE